MILRSRLTRLQKNFLSLVAITGAVFITYEILSNTWANHKQGNRVEQLNFVNNQTKRILYYNPPSWFTHFNFDQCKYSRCATTTNKSFLTDSDAVIFQHSHLPPHPPFKSSQQKWIFTCSESAYYGDKTCSTPQWRHRFDWIMSYRRDSDFFFGYGDIISKEKFLEKDYDRIFNQKKGLVAWIASHCDTQSQREKYVAEMSEIAKVDVFGGCGSKKCEKYGGNENDSCHSFVGQNYKFYLSFENSLCRDYTTEKFYNIYEYDHPIIPVVMGSFTAEEYLHGAVYIDVNKFRTPFHLTRRLLALGNDKEAYIDLLRRKDSFGALTSGETFKTAMCKVCEYLTLDKPGRVDFNVAEWFFGEEHCHSPKQIGIPRKKRRENINLEEAKKYLNQKA